MTRLRYPLGLSVAIALAGCTTASHIPWNPNPELTVGQSVILKGVRTRCDGRTAPTYAAIEGNLPTSRLGTFSDGGTGTVQSVACGEAVPGRAVKFTATTPGRESFTIAGDQISVVVTN